MIINTFFFLYNIFYLYLETTAVLCADQKCTIFLIQPAYIYVKFTNISKFMKTQIG